MIHGFGSLTEYIGQYQIKQTFISASATPTKMIGPNPNRVALFIVSGSSGETIGFNGSVSLTNFFYNFSNLSFSFLRLYWPMDGPLCQQEFWVTRVTGTSNIAITEVLYVPTA